MTILSFIIAALATWRIASLFVHEAGPLKVFQRVREAAGIVHDEEGQPISIPETFLGELFSCVWCLSLWVGAYLALMLWLTGDIAAWLLLPFALSTVAVSLERWNRP